MPVIVFASSKGGAGKTTACRLLAGEFARQAIDKNISISLIDADPNQHTAAWALMDGCPKNITLIQNSNEESILDDYLPPLKSLSPSSKYDLQSG